MRDPCNWPRGGHNIGHSIATRLRDRLADAASMVGRGAPRVSEREFCADQRLDHQGADRAREIVSLAEPTAGIPDPHQGVAETGRCRQIRRAGGPAIRPAALLRGEGDVGHTTGHHKFLSRAGRVAKGV